MFFKTMVQEFVEGIFSCTKHAYKQTNKYQYIGLKPTHQKLQYVPLWLSCTVRSGLHEIPTMIRTYPHGLENKHACKWTFGNFPGMITYILFLENCQKTICMDGYSPIRVDRSLRVSNLGDKYVPYFQEEKLPFHMDWRTTMHANEFQTIFLE